MSKTYTITLTPEELRLLIQAMIECLQNMPSMGCGVYEMKEWDKRIEELEAMK